VVPNGIADGGNAGPSFPPRSASPREWREEVFYADEFIRTIEGFPSSLHCVFTRVVRDSRPGERGCLPSESTGGAVVDVGQVLFRIDPRYLRGRWGV